MLSFRCVQQEHQKNNNIKTNEKEVIDKINQKCYYLRVPSNWCFTY